jgi:hypothetical protein
MSWPSEEARHLATPNDAIVWYDYEHEWDDIEDMCHITGRPLWLTAFAPAKPAKQPSARASFLGRVWSSPIATAASVLSLITSRITAGKKVGPL